MIKGAASMASRPFSFSFCEERSDYDAMRQVAVIPSLSIFA